MRRFALLVFFMMLPLCIFAAPFGLKMGMTIDEIAKQCEEGPAHIEDDIYIIEPVKKHPLFEYYAVYIDEKEGLYQIRAISDEIKCNKYGAELQNAFHNVKDRIAKTYGNPKVTDKVDTNSLFKDDDYWFYTLKEGSRELYATWGEETELSDNLAGIVLDCVASSYGKGQLVLYYYFKNADNVEDAQDSVF